jgi:hypothetical protein
MDGVKLICGPKTNDPRSTFAVPVFYQGQLVDYIIYRVLDRSELDSVMRVESSRTPT